MAEIGVWATAQIRAAIAESNLWDYAVHLRCLLEQDVAAIENAASLEEIRQSFESLLAALKAVVAQKKTKSLTVEAALNFQENQRFSFWLLEQARSLLDKNSIEISKIPRDLAPEKPAISVPPSTPRPPLTPVKMDPLKTPSSPFTGLLPPNPDVAATHLNLQDSIQPTDSVSRTSSTSSMRRRRKLEEVKVRKEELMRINELEKEKERKENQRQKEEEEKEEAMRKVKEEWEEMEAKIEEQKKKMRKQMEEKMRLTEKEGKEKVKAIEIELNEIERVEKIVIADTDEKLAKVMDDDDGDSVIVVPRSAAASSLPLRGIRRIPEMKYRRTPIRAHEVAPSATDCYSKSS